MKLSKKMSLALGLSVVLVSSLATTSMAYVDCSRAEVLKVGTSAGLAASNITGSSTVQVKCLSDTSWGTKEFYPVTAISDEVMAASLTALSLDKTVYIRVGAATTGSLLTIMYVNK